MNLSYSREKFFTAVHTLATGTDSLRERLGDAYQSSLMRLTPDDLPEEIQQDFRTLTKELTKIEASGDEGRIIATVRQMSEQEAQVLAKSIMYMFSKIIYDPE